MEREHGARRKERTGGSRKPKSRAGSRRDSRAGSRKSKSRPASRRDSRADGRRQEPQPRRAAAVPPTAKLPSKKEEPAPERRRFSRAASGMNMTELQFMAKSRGIPFGGLTKTKLIRKINNYY